jgi:hypothetical protein
MSETPAMTNERRLNSYLNCGRSVLTAAQHRRLRHKVRHAYTQRHPAEPRARRHDLEGLTAYWEEANRMGKPPEKVPSDTQQDQLDRITADRLAPTPRHPIRLTWSKKAGRRARSG